jgi:vacuolar-type H+-ATPase subunit E/Vma4
VIDKSEQLMSPLIYCRDKSDKPTLTDEKICTLSMKVRSPRETHVVDSKYRASRGIKANARDTKNIFRRASNMVDGTLAEAHESLRHVVTTHDYRKLQTNHQHATQLPLPPIAIP